MLSNNHSDDRVVETHRDHPLFSVNLVLFLQLRQQNKKNPNSWQVSRPPLSEFSGFDPGDSHKDDQSFRAKYKLSPNKDS